MPRTKSGDVPASSSRRGRGSGSGRSRDRDEIVVDRPGRGGRRGVRTRGGSGRGGVDRSPYYMGDILTKSPDASTVHSGVPLEQPLTQRRPRRWDCNRSVSPVETVAFVSAETFSTPNTLLRAAVPMQAPSSAELEMEIDRTSAAGEGTSGVAEPSSSGSAETSSTPSILSSAAECMQVPSQAELEMEIDRTLAAGEGTSGVAEPSSSGSSRKQEFGNQDGEVKALRNMGSDDESGTDDDDVALGSIHFPRGVSMYEYMQPEEDLAEPEVKVEPVPESPEPATTSPGSSVPYGPASLSEFDWKPLPSPPISPLLRREPFTSPTGPVTNFCAPYDAFVAIWDRSIMELIAAETNRYAEQTLEAALNRGDLDGYSRKLHFTDTNADELFVYFAVLLATGMVFKADLSEYWSVNDNIFDTPNFSRYMTFRRFQLISQMLHFVNNEVNIDHLSQAEAKVWKIAPIVEHLNEKFQALYQLGQCIALDESLTQWKGLLSINQFIKTKAASQGVKTYEVCDSNSGYLWRFKIHAGRSEEEQEFGHVTSPVLELLRGLENKGHTVFMDNYYNSPLLARLLKSKGFDCVGTLRLNRQNVPATLKDLVKQPLDAGSVHGATSGDVDVLVWKDKNVVSLISTYHGAASASRDGKAKPTLVHDYNVRMGGVDKKDQMLSAYPVERKRTAVWYKKLFRRLLNVSVLNAYVLHKESSAPEQPHPHLSKHRLFRKNLILQILAKHGEPRRATLQPLRSAARVKFSSEMARHLPAEFPFHEHGKQRKRGYCGVCRKRTTLHCGGCNVALCLGECFLKFHS